MSDSSVCGFWIGEDLNSSITDTRLIFARRATTLIRAPGRANTLTPES